MLSRRGSDSIRRLWWGVDLWSMITLVLIMIIGVILIATSSPAVAERIHLSSFHFLYKHLIFLTISFPVLVFFSRVSEKFIRKFTLIGSGVTFLLMIAVLFIGDEIKGARRWINVLGFSLQPSEFSKSFLAIIIGLLLAERDKSFPGMIVAILLYFIVCGLLLLQPDFGMTVSITVATASQFFIAGLPLVFVGFGICIAIIGGILAYFIFPHVAKRIDSFLHSDELENYQVTKSLEAYANGGLFGRGPGEGAVKYTLPDSHTDFIFAVAAEEFGGICTIIILSLFIGFIIRGLFLISRHHNLFHIYSCVGLLLHFTFQTIFNIGVTLHLLPTKGMTLPFISYGGSSIISFAMGMGIYLNFLQSQHFSSKSSSTIYNKKVLEQSIPVFVNTKKYRQEEE